MLVLDLLVTGMVRMAVGIADARFQNAFDIGEILLGTPEAAAGQVDFVTHRVSSRIGFMTSDITVILLENRGKSKSQDRFYPIMFVGLQYILDK